MTDVPRDHIIPTVAYMLSHMTALKHRLDAISGNLPRISRFYAQIRLVSGKREKLAEHFLTPNFLDVNLSFTSSASSASRCKRRCHSCLRILRRNQQAEFVRIKITWHRRLRQKMSKWKTISEICASVNQNSFAAGVQVCLGKNAND